MSLRFGAYFADQYGSRWSKLLDALKQPGQNIAFVNRLAVHPDEISNRMKDHESPWNDVFALQNWPIKGAGRGNVHVFMLSPPKLGITHVGYPPPPADRKSGLLDWYWMDLASLLPPLLLEVEPGHRVLDACSAPGGKSIVLANILFGGDSPPRGQLTCNDKNKNRRIRLASVLQSYLGQSLLGKTTQYVRISGHSADAWWGVSEAYDRILVDAPCSSERHIIHQCSGDVDAIDREDWSVAKCTRLSKLQIRMVLTAFQALKTGGRIVYSTCSLDYKQNDKVIEKVLKKLSGCIHVISHDEQFEHIAGNLPWPIHTNSDGSDSGPPRLDGSLTKTNQGWLALPDECGWGPLYMAVLEKSGNP